MRGSGRVPISVRRLRITPFMVPSPRSFFWFVSAASCLIIARMIACYGRRGSSVLA